MHRQFMFQGLQGSIGTDIIPKDEVYAEHDNTSKSVFIRLFTRGIALSLGKSEKFWY
jgi:hypothetical protein